MFYRDYAFRVISERENGRYRIKYALISDLQPLSRSRFTLPATPERTVGELLGESLGGSRFINSMDHPVVRVLTMGDDLR